jgi:hypothetical protein
MNVKVLIQTLTELPEAEMLDELINHFRSQNKIMVSDLKKVFSLVAALYSSHVKDIVQRGTQLVELLCRLLIATEI